MKFDAIGTRWQIETDEPLSDALAQKIMKRIEQFDTTYSRFRDDSLVSRVARRAGEYRFPDDVEPLIDLYSRLYDATDGAVTPLVGDALNAMGYDRAYSFRKKEAVQVGRWEEVMAWSGPIVTTKRPLTFDVGAAGKGYLVDSIGELLEGHNIKSYVIDASGDVRHRGAKKQVVGLEHPTDPTRVIGAVPLQNASLCASATNRRRWGDDLHHVIDGRSGEPARDVTATWVLAESTLKADGLSTALFFANPAKLRGHGEFQFVRMFADGKVEYSSDFVGELFV